MDVVMIVAIAILGGCGMVITIVWLITTARSRSAQVQAQVQAKLIDKFSSAPELVQFLQSPAGHEFVAGAESAPKMHARDRIIGGIRKSIIFAMLGFGFLFLCIPEETRNEGFLVAGAILTALGVGNFLSTLISMKLSKQWGLIERNDDGDINSPIL